MIKTEQLALFLILSTALALTGARAASASTVATAAAQTTALAASAGSAAAFYHHYGFGHFGFGHHGHHYGYGHYSHYSYYRPYGYYGYYRPYSTYRYGYYGRYGYPYGYPGSAGSDAEQYGAIDLNVKPSKAEVYVDGTYVGVVDQFDGFPSYLWLEEGLHKLVFYKEGYETVMREIAVQPGHRVNLRTRMARGTATAPEEIVPPPPEPAPAEVASSADADGPGRLMVVVAPDDAVIYIDGHFFGVAGELGHVRSGLPIEAGEHKVEIARPGYRTIERMIRVESGEALTLDATMRPR